MVFFSSLMPRVKVVGLPLKFDCHMQNLWANLLFLGLYLCAPCALPNVPRALSVPRQWHFYTMNRLPVHAVHNECTAPPCVFATRSEFHHELLVGIRKGLWGGFRVGFLGKMLNGRWERWGVRGQGEWSETLVPSSHFATPAVVFLVIFSWLTLCSWVSFKHLINTISMIKLMEKRCQQGLSLVLLAFTKIWSGLAIFYAPGYVRRTPSPVRHMPGVHRALVNFSLQAGCVCAAPSVSTTLLAVCAAPSKTSTHSLKRSQFGLLTSAMSLQVLQEHNGFDLGHNKYTYRLGRDGFDFFFIENPLSNVCVLHFLNDFRTHWFSFFLWNFGSHDGIFGISLRGPLTRHLAMETMTASEKVNWWFFGKFCHKWPCLTFLQNRVLMKSLKYIHMTMKFSEP